MRAHGSSVNVGASAADRPAHRYRPWRRLSGILVVGLVGLGIAGEVWSQGTRGPGSQATPPLLRGSWPAPVKRGIRPPEAYDLSVRGFATVRCRIDKSRLTDCEAESESPVGMGFGSLGARSLERERLDKWEMIGLADGDIVLLPLTMAPRVESNRPPVSGAFWRQAPTFEQVDAAWPVTAGDRATGSAALRCTVGVDGLLEACAVAGEVPARSAFGEAALTLASSFSVEVAADGQSPDPAYDVLVSFRFHNPSSPAGQTRQIDKPDWIDSPGQQEIMAAFPAEAKAASVKEGVGVVICQVAERGQLVGCAASQEAPEGLGFGRSAVALAKGMRLAPWTKDGRPVVGGRIKFSIRFSPTPASAPPKSKSLDGAGG
jgi:hypothetical protein